MNNKVYEEDIKLAELAGKLEDVLKKVKEHEKKVNDYLRGKK